MDAVPVILFWSLAAWGLFARSPLALLYLFFASAPFGAFAVIPPALVGGVTLLPQSMCALLLLIKVMAAPRALPTALRAAFAHDRFLLLTLFIIVAATSAIVLPRLFAGKVEVIPMRMTLISVKVPLEPTTANFTQTAYLCLSYGAALSVFILLANQRMAQHLKYAVLLSSSVLIGTGLADMATAGSDLLSPFRTASYSLLTGVEVQGARRVVGLTPEASAFGGQCVLDFCLLLFLRPTFPAGRLKTFVLPAALVGLLALAALSTSSTAYVGLAAVLGLAGLDWLRRALSPEGKNKGILVQDVAIMVVGLAVILALVAFEPNVLAPAADMIDHMVFQKAQSASFAERSYWTAVGVDAFKATWGLGVGVGSARTSSLMAALLSNTGAVGTALMGGFIMQTLLRRTTASQEIDTLRATKYGLLSSIFLGLLAATSPDFGIFGGVMFAWSANLANAPNTQLPMRRHFSGASWRAIPLHSKSGG